MTHTSFFSYRYIIICCNTISFYNIFYNSFYNITITHLRLTHHNSVLQNIAKN